MFDFQEFNSRGYESIKNTLFVSVVNTQRNAYLLEDAPHIDKGDISLTVRAQVDVSEKETATFPILNHHIKKFGITEEQLFKDAFDNSILLKPAQIELSIEVDGSVIAYVLTNEDKYCGAATMYYPEVLEKFREQIKQELLIIPSSVHECLLCPCNIDVSERELQEMSDNYNKMVREVNRTELDPEEILADCVFFYDHDRKEIVNFEAYQKELCEIRRECVRAGFSPSKKLVAGIKEVMVLGNISKLKDIAEASKVQKSTGNPKLDAAIANVASICKQQQMAKLQEPPVL